MFRELDSVCVYRWNLQRERADLYWAQLGMLNLKTETESTLRNIGFLIKDRTMDNVQNCDSYIKVNILYHRHKPATLDLMFCYLLTHMKQMCPC
jgi:hypothetical protein